MLAAVPDLRYDAHMPNITQPITRRAFLKKAGVLLGAGALLSSYPFLIERYLLEVNTYRIPVPHLPPAFEGFRILQLTDMHIGPFTSAAYLQSAVQIANSINKDITVFTGDAVQSSVPDDDIRKVWQILSGLRAPKGVFAVLGNHDHWIGLDKSITYAQRSGLLLRHMGVRLQRDGQHLWLGGLGDLWDDDLGVEACFANSDARDCRIALAHNPDTADRDLPCPIDLMICGHTNGGQVQLPVLTKMITPVSNKDYIQGYIKTANTRLFISRGIGWGGIPIRFRCPPELSLLVLAKE